MSWRSTNSTTNACLAGASKALAIPNKPARITICQGCTAPLKTSPARMKASAIMVDWVMISRVRREMRSAITPPYRVKIQDGSPDTKPT